MDIDKLLKLIVTNCHNGNGQFVHIINRDYYRDNYRLLKDIVKRADKEGYRLDDFAHVTARESKRVAYSTSVNKHPVRNNPNNLFWNVTN